MAIRVITGAPAEANWPTSVRRSVIRPAERAWTFVLLKSSSAFSRLLAALSNWAFSSSLPPCCSRARCTSALAAATWLMDSSRVARDISRRRSEMVPGSSLYRRSSRWMSWRALSSLAWDARSDACLESTPAVLAPTWRRVDSRSARARSTAIWYCSGLTSNSNSPAFTSWLLRTCTLVTRPDTSAATGTMKACTRACCV
ncbi:hypothetical protein D9M73_132450 [compost metagenome]